MHLTLKLKLNPSLEQRAILRQTIQRANEACNGVSQLAWDNQTFRQFDLHKLVYTWMRQEFDLGAQIVIRCIAKVANSYKLDKKTKRDFRLLGAIAYDARILSYQMDQHTVSIWTLNGREKIAFQCASIHEGLLKFQKGESDLVLIKGEFYLLATVVVPDKEQRLTTNVLGVDLGIVNLVTDSDGNVYSGQQVEPKRQWYLKRRPALQKVGTRSAKRHLKRLAGRQHRFQTNTNHVISRRLVTQAERTNRAIALEDLKGIRSRTRVLRAEQRHCHSNWSFSQLRQFVTYKTLLLGIPLVLIDPRYTSQKCSQCGHTERANRVSQASFKCKKCGYTCNADGNAATNIKWAAVKQPLVSNLRVEMQAQAL